jgi:hypothetical protein
MPFERPGFSARQALGPTTGFDSVHHLCSYLTYLYYAGTLPGGFLAYYAPIAVSCQRTFLVLTSICLLAACDK